jgi:dTDP-4-amino-4,6-dideoxygalactose transaminase
MPKNYKVSVPFISSKEVQEVTKVLRSGWLTSGPKTKVLEEIIKKKIKTKNVIAVNSATSGIFITLVALGAQRGDEVITPSNTYISTINSLYNLGLKIIFCDINLLTGNVDLVNFKKKISKKTKFFIPVHNGGNPLDIDELIKISKKNKIQMIDDGATAFGAKINNKFIGSYNYTSTVFSLHANKVITSGEGGFICTNNNELSKKIRLLINSGLSKDTWNRKKAKNYRILNALVPGYKLNFNDILASIAIVQIKKINQILNFRIKIKKYYIKKLNKIIKNKIIYIPEIKKNYISAHYNFPIIISGNKKVRNKLANFLQTKNIYTTIHYTPAHKHQFYKMKIVSKNLNNTDKLFNTTLALPFHNKLSFKDVDFISQQILNFFNDKR